MARRVLTEEGVLVPPNHYMVEGAIYVEDDAVIEIVNTNFEHVGYARDIRREGKQLTGEVDCEIPKEYECSFYLTRVESHEFKDITFVTSARLFEVCLRPLPGYPKGDLRGEEA